MIQRIALAGAGLAVTAVLAACTSPDTPEEENSPSPPAASASATEDPEQPGVMTTQGALLPDFPAAIEPLPDSEIVSSSLGSDSAVPESATPEGEAGGGEDGSAENQPAESGDQASAALVMRTAMSEEEILDFYTGSLESHGFAVVGEPSSQDGVTTQAFHAEEDEQTVSVSIGPDPANEAQRLVTVGGVVNR